MSFITGLRGKLEPENPRVNEKIDGVSGEDVPFWTKPLKFYPSFWGIRRIYAYQSVESHIYRGSLSSKFGVSKRDPFRGFFGDFLRGHNPSLFSLLAWWFHMDKLWQVTWEVPSFGHDSPHQPSFSQMDSTRCKWMSTQGRRAARGYVYVVWSSLLTGGVLLIMG